MLRVSCFAIKHSGTAEKQPLAEHPQQGEDTTTNRRNGTAFQHDLPSLNRCRKTPSPAGARQRCISGSSQQQGSTSTSEQDHSREDQIKRELPEMQIQGSHQSLHRCRPQHQIIVDNSPPRPHNVVTMQYILHNNQEYNS